MKSKRNPRKSVKKSAIKPDSPRKLFPGLSENQARFKSIACQKVQSEGITGDLDMGLLDVGEFSVKEIADDICAMLSDEHLRALLSVKDFDCESAYSLLTNLHSYWNRRGKKNELQPFRESIFQNLTILAKAIKAGKSECLGRTINSWLKTWTATGCGEKNLYWAERRAKTLANDPLFKSGLESVFKIWPEELSTFHNVFIPNWEGGVINLETASIIEQHEAIDLWRNAVDCSEEFLRIARQFVLDWNLSYLQFSTSDCFGFERNEIIDPLSFKKKLTQSSDGVSAFLRENMPAETSRAMDNFPRLSPLLYAYYLTRHFPYDLLPTTIAGG